MDAAVIDAEIWTELLEDLVYIILDELCRY
jgi:hypothetical protein